MIVTPLGLHSPAGVRDALQARGWAVELAESAAGGLLPAAFLIAGAEPAAIEALVPFAGRLGLELITGDGWVLLSGPRSRLGAAARPWTVPEPLRELSHHLGLAMQPDVAGDWITARGRLPLDPPAVIGIVNVTPDSFSDGGAWAEPAAALERAETLIAEGAAAIDVGGESSRPGAAPVDADEERRRVLPVIEQLAARHSELVISIDTVKSAVARDALAAGAAAVNDVSAGRLDPRMLEVVSESGAGIVLMHSRGSFEEMASYTHADYGIDPVAAVLSELAAALGRATDAGIAPERIVLDPGFGFSKRVEQNILLGDQLAALAALGRPLLVGPSRKRFLGAVTGAELTARDRITAVACALLYERGARLFRVHDVAGTREALALARAFGARASGEF